MLTRVHANLYPILAFALLLGVLLSACCLPLGVLLLESLDGGGRAQGQLHHAGILLARERNAVILLLEHTFGINDIR